MTDMTDDLDESMLAEIEATECVATPPNKDSLLRPATDDEMIAFVDNIVAQNPGLVHRFGHWSLTLFEIMRAVDYKPHPSVLANQSALKLRDMSSRLAIVQNHVSPMLLEDLSRQIQHHAAEGTLKAPRRADSDGTIVETDEGGLAYSSDETTVEKSSSEDKEGWASW